MYTALLYSPFSKQEDEKGFITTSAGGGGELGSPESLPELDRPPLRKIDQYIRPDCPCCNMTKRYTVAFLASIGNRFNFKLYVLDLWWMSCHVPRRHKSASGVFNLDVLRGCISALERGYSRRSIILSEGSHLDSPASSSSSCIFEWILFLWK